MRLTPAEIDTRALGLRMLLLDVDGVLTDGSIVVHGDGSEAKSFFIRDGLALVWAQRAGLQVGLLSGRRSDATTRRAAELGISLLVQGETDKRAAYSRIRTVHGLQDDQIAYMGDDLLDVPVLSCVGLAAAPSDAVDDVRACVHWQSRFPGGRGAVREFVEMLLRARGAWDGIVQSLR